LNIDFHDFDANRAPIGGRAGENQAAQAVLTFRLPILHVRLGRKVATVDSIGEISLTSVFAKVGRVSPRSYKPVEIGAPPQTKRETLVAEAGTETCHERRCFAERLPDEPDASFAVEALNPDVVCCWRVPLSGEPLLAVFKVGEDGRAARTPKTAS
jgi:hypothetical protein